MLNMVKSRAARVAALFLPMLLAACVITTEKAYFTASDFVRPKIVDGVWDSVPAEANDQVMRIRVSVHGRHWRAQPLKAGGMADTSEKPEDFSLVQLSPGKFIVVHADKPNGPIDYLGLKGEEDKLDFWLFSGGETEGGKANFASLLKSVGLSGAASEYSHDVRLSGDITKEKLKKLFAALLAEPEKYDGHKSEYKRVNP